MSAMPTPSGRPFSDAQVLVPVGDGGFRAELGDLWAVGTKAHGGLLMVLMARAALLRLADAAGGGAPDPLAVAVDFLRAPDLGPIELRTEVLKTGRAASVCAVRLLQDGRLMLAGSVTAGRVPQEQARWAEVVSVALEPGPDALPGTYTPDRSEHGLATALQRRFPAEENPFLRGQTGPPRTSGWVRPRGEEPDVFFALLACDVLAPTLCNLDGVAKWAPTVQLTALLRAHPAPGWLRVDARSEVIVGTWFDEDVTVRDSRGRLVCQARQLALAPRE